MMKMLKKLPQMMMGKLKKMHLVMMKMLKKFNFWMKKNNEDSIFAVEGIVIL